MFLVVFFKEHNVLFFFTRGQSPLEPPRLQQAFLNQPNFKFRPKQT